MVKALMNTIQVFCSETLVLAQYFSPEKWHLFPMLTMHNGYHSSGVFRINSSVHLTAATSLVVLA